MDTLPELHARPKGEIFVAMLDGTVTGCGMSYEQSPGACEIKRLYVAPGGRGHGLGRQLCNTLIEQARADGYALVRLDTMHSLTEAIRLYETLGFERRNAYYTLPDIAVPIVRFYELPL